jgi:hypothetical protein
MVLRRRRFRVVLAVVVGVLVLGFVLPFAMSNYGGSHSPGVVHGQPYSR